jgi:hypothetical protein
MFVANTALELDGPGEEDGPWAEGWADRTGCSGIVVAAPSLPQLIGLTGRAGAGKDTAADHLVRQYGYKKFALAGAMKRGLNAMFGWCDADWEDRKWKESPNAALGGRSPREAAITIGTEWGRNMIDSDVWLRPLYQYMESSPQVRIVVTDVRFNNEASAIVALGGRVWLIRGPAARVVSINHKSERGVDDIWVDSIIINDGPKEHLYGVVDSLLTEES